MMNVAADGRGATRYTGGELHMRRSVLLAAALAAALLCSCFMP